MDRSYGPLFRTINDLIRSSQLHSVEKQFVISFYVEVCI